MSSQNHLQSISVGMFFSLNYIYEFKKRLEFQEGQDLIILQNDNELSIHCSNNDINTCPFTYIFEKKIDAESQDIGLQLKKQVRYHSSQCKVNDEKSCYNRIHLAIQQSKELIRDILLKRYQLYGPQNPKITLQSVSKALGSNKIFIYVGLRDLNLKRSLKKKFDNLIGSIRKQYNLYPTIVKKNKTKKRKHKKIGKFSVRYDKKNKKDARQTQFKFGKEDIFFEDQMDSEQMMSQSQDQQSQFVVCQRDIRTLKISQQIKNRKRMNEEKSYMTIENLETEQKSLNTHDSEDQKQQRNNKRI